MTPLDIIKERAQEAGLAEAICNNCSWFNRPKDGAMGTCRKRRNEVQFQFGICLSWTNGATDDSKIDPDRSVASGERKLFAGADSPKAQKPPVGENKTLVCAEPDCGARLELRWSIKLQRYFYGCARYPDCNGTLPAHEDGSPRGEPRTRELQGWRNRAHEAFDKIWKSGDVKRAEAYSWLRAATNLGHDDAHMSKMDIEQCKMVILFVDTKGPGTEFWERWKAERKERKREKARSRRRSRKASSPKPSNTR